MFLNWSFSNVNELPKTGEKKKQKLPVLQIKTKDKQKEEIWGKKETIQNQKRYIVPQINLEIMYSER